MITYNDVEILISMHTYKYYRYLHLICAITYTLLTETALDSGSENALDPLYISLQGLLDEPLPPQ